MAQTPLMMGNKVLDDARIFRIYTVRGVKGDWLWLVSGSHRGWARSELVVTFDRAIDYYTHEIQNHPSSAFFYANRGSVWLEKHNHDKAIADFSEALRLDPRDVAAYVNRGLSWTSKKHHDRALADYDEALRLDPKRSDTYVNRGCTLGAMNQFDEALADFDRAIALDPKSTESFVNRGHVWRGKKNYENALADYAAALRLDPDESRAHASLAWLRVFCPDPRYRNAPRALESATRACDLTGWKDPRSLDILAASYALAGDFSRAVEFQQKANALDSDPESRAKGVERLTYYQDKISDHTEAER